MKKISFRTILEFTITMIIMREMSRIYEFFHLEKYISTDILLIILLLAFLAGCIYTFRQLRK
ncbi:MAG: hypothetical protein ACERKZ_12620 [Lachnotalea sp.]